MTAAREKLASYAGQTLCPCCGKDDNGATFPICTDPDISHDESCAVYQYGDDVCQPCEAEMAKRYRETYGSDSYSPEQVARMVAAAPVVVRPKPRRP